MRLRKADYLVISYAPLIFAYAGSTQTLLDTVYLKNHASKIIVFQHLTWWAGDESSMRQYQVSQEKLEKLGIEHHLMVNAFDEEAQRIKFGVRGAMCTKNIFCNENIFTLAKTNKNYDAIYIAQLQRFKRHELAKDIKKLLTISYGGDLAKFCPDIAHAESNKIPLPAGYVADYINQSYCGLCLSAIEGQMRAAVEYLLCGVPVVTTPSKGGRDIFFNDTKSITVLPSSDGVAKAVAHWKDSAVHPRIIRAEIIEKLTHWRGIYCRYITDLILENGKAAEDADVLYSRLFIVKKNNSSREVAPQLILNRKAMASFATENYSHTIELNSGIKINQNSTGDIEIENSEGVIVTLNDISAVVLNICNQGVSIAEVLIYFRAHYEEAPASLEEEVLSILETFFELEIIDIAAACV